MNLNKTAFIFPAFGERITEKDIDFYNKNKNHFDKYFLQIKEKIGVDFSNFVSDYPEIVKNELYSQYTAFAFSAVVSDVLKNKIKPSFTAGYSMGLYSALYSSSSINFISGILLIQKIYNLIIEAIKDKNFSIAVIIGLELHDVRKILEKSKTSVEIINSNNKYSFVISGISSAVEAVLNLCINEGAMNSRILPIKSPYHSEFVHKPADIFHEFILKEISISDPEIPVISAVDQRLVSTKKDVILELVWNIKHNISWNNTILKMLEFDISDFIECGIGKSLTKIAKLIEGEFKIHPHDIEI
jgi:[acyl-carrier-protein] S-malonyltransferase